MKKALLVGINNYPDPQNQLNGCVNDVNHVRDILVNDAGYTAGSIVTLIDAAATTSTITNALRTLVSGAASGDRLTFFYSGHGAPVPETDSSGNTIAIHDAMCPYDFDWTDAHAIRDVDFTRLFGNIPGGAKLSWLSDSCYAGGYAKLFALLLGQPTALIKTIPPPPNIHAQIVQFQQRHEAVTTHFKDIAQTLKNVAFLAACGASQESSDAQWSDGSWDGVFTYYLSDQYSHSAGNAKSAQQIVTDLNSAIQQANRFSQRPELHGDPALASSPVFQ